MNEDENEYVFILIFIEIIVLMKIIYHGKCHVTCHLE